jgi:hypothetical protein
MEKLYLETPLGVRQIDQAIREKYNLKKGTLSPFTCNRIVGSGGDYPLMPFGKDLCNRGTGRVPFEGFKDDGVDQMDHGAELSTSEILDISQGVDSD